MPAIEEVCTKGRKNFSKKRIPNRVVRHRPERLIRYASRPAVATEEPTSCPPSIHGPGCCCCGYLGKRRRLRRRRPAAHGDV